MKFQVKSTPAFRNVHAKTGSFTAINALAGYLKMKNGHEVAFAIMNQNVLSAAKARAFQDKVCEVIIREIDGVIIPKLKDLPLLQLCTAEALS